MNFLFNLVDNFKCTKLENKYLKFMALVFKRKQIKTDICNKKKLKIKFIKISLLMRIITSNSIKFD